MALQLSWLPLYFTACFLHSRMMIQRHKQLNPAAKFSWIPLEVVKESFKFDFNYFWKVLFLTIVLNLFCIFYCFPSLLKVPSKNTRSSVWNLLAMQLEIICMSVSIFIVKIVEVYSYFWNSNSFLMPQNLKSTFEMQRRFFINLKIGCNCLPSFNEM